MIAPYDDTATWPTMLKAKLRLAGSQALSAQALAAASVAKPVTDVAGRAGYHVELPEVFPHTRALVRRLAAAPLSAETAAEPAADLDERFTEVVRRCGEERHWAVDSDQDTPVLRGPRQAFTLERDGAVLTVALPRVLRVAPEAIDPLRSWALRVNAEALLARVQVDETSLRLAACVPLDAGAAGACAAVWIARRALLDLQSALPPLTTVVDPELGPLLRLAGSGRCSVPLPTNPHEVDR